MRSQVQANNGNWQEALLAQEVLLAALDARRRFGAAEQDVMDMIAANDYAVIVARSLSEFADGRLFFKAVRRASAVTEVDASPWHPPGAVEFSLGVLHQDPYVYKRTMLNFDLQITAWRRRPIEQLGPMVGELEAGELLMPEPLDAFTASSKYFLASADKSAGPSRGQSLKGYISAEVWKHIAGGQAAPDLAQRASEAKQLLDHNRYMGVRAEIDSLLDVLRFESSKRARKADTDWMATAKQLLNTSTAELVEQKGIIEATDLMGNVAFAIADTSANIAFELWQKALPLVLKRDENTRKGFYAVGLGYIRAAMAHPNVANFISNSPLESADRCRHEAAAEGWPPQQLAATLLSIAVNSQAGDHEPEGVRILDLVADADDAFLNNFRPLILWQSGILYRGIASTMFHANRFADAIRAYSTSAAQFLTTNMPVEADEMMGLAVDIVMRSEDQLAKFAEYFRSVIPELERQGGSTVVHRVQELCRNWMPLLATTGQVNLPVSMMLLDSVKGSAFASELRAGGDFAWVNSDESRTLLNRIEQMQASLGDAVGKTAAAGTLSEEILLTMYAEDEEMKSGDNPAVVLHNLQIRYDAELRRRLSGRAPREAAWIGVPDRIAAVLGPETVLLTYYSGVTPNGNAGLYVNVFTCDSATGTIVDLDTPGMRVLMNGVLDTVAIGVMRVRYGVNEDPEDGIVSVEARKALEVCLAYIGGPTGEILQKLRKEGKWHLCIQPHGPLHFFPFHLLPYEKDVLAQEWTITYLPNLALLDPAHRNAAIRDVPIASFGIEFRNGIPHSLPKLPGAEDEARLVALAYGATGTTGSAATETTLVAALANACRVHIATHGLHKVSAPSFQRVYLSPDADTDGILYAYELLRYDLRGLDLLTLSACETSLGRVDIGDNFWGLSANALVAGAATVVGTLWPVENSAAKTFFELLHKKIAEGSEKRAAFHTAQESTRLQHPQFRDWGAFCYSGRW
jgi:hypothetical protein